MSFKLNWNAIEKDSFSAYARELLDEALNSGKRPSILSDDIRIVDLNFGTIAPVFQILEIGDLAVDKFRGIFNFKYYGDASITVTTKISASLLKNYNNNIGDEFDFIKPNFIVSDCDFDIPLNLTLSNFKMSSIIIIVFSKTKGLTLVFKNDPLENIDVNSTFDRITPIANFLQKKIESQISDLFKEFLPSLLYKFSLKYTTQSFDQFHKDLLIEEQEEDDNRKKNMILLKDLDPENPFRISPGSLMRSTRLSSMRQTLSLGNGIDKLSCDRFNKDIITKAFLNIIINNSNSYNSNRIELTDRDFEFGDVHDKLNFIKNFQIKAYNRNIDHKPKRRTIKMNVKTKSKPKVKVMKNVEDEEFTHSITMDRSNNSLFSDHNNHTNNSNSTFSDLETSIMPSSVMMSKAPSMSKNGGFPMSRGLSPASSNISSMNITNIPTVTNLTQSGVSTIVNTPILSAVTMDGDGNGSMIHEMNLDNVDCSHTLRKKSFNYEKRNGSKSRSRRPSSNVTSSSTNTSRSRRAIFQSNFNKIDKEEEKEIHRRMKKLDKLMSKKFNNINNNDSNNGSIHDEKRLMFQQHHHQINAPPPPPYSL